MPIIEKDPWREQYFKDVYCPDDVIIPTDDELAYELYPGHRWIYNKLLICESQGLENGPHGIVPSRFPVFSKPIYNLRGMGKDSKVITTTEELEQEYRPGHMWMPLLEGEHVSSDATIVKGEAVWWRHTIGKPLEEGTFDYWTALAESRPEIEGYCGGWSQANLAGYTGMVNFETIGGTIIECHLRFSDQFVDLYGQGWMESVVELYAHKRWDFRDDSRCTGYSVVLFGKHGVKRKKADSTTVAQQLKEPGVSSIQITFHDDKPPEAHSMPPGGFRLAIVNCWDLDVGQKVRQRLASMF